MASLKVADIEERGLAKKPGITLIKSITSPLEFRKAIHDSEVVVVFVYGKCGYCRLLAPLVESAARLKEFEIVMFYKVDVNGEGLRDTIKEELYTPGAPCVFVFHLGRVFRFLDGYIHNFSFKDWLASAVSASERAMDGAVVSHPDLLRGNPPTIIEITSLELFQNTIGSTQRPVVLYLHSTRSSEHKYFSRIFECGASSLVFGTSLYCILDSDKHTEIVEKIGIDVMTGVVGFLGGEMLGWSMACRTWGNFGLWLFEFSDAIGIVDSASANKWTVPLSDQIIPITKITSLRQLRETFLAHNHVAINFVIDQRPISRAVSLVFERAAADSTLSDIYFAKVNVGEQEDIVRLLGDYAEAGTISLFFGGDIVAGWPVMSDSLDSLKKDLLKHIGISDDFTHESETDANSPDEFAPGEKDQLEHISTSDDFIDGWTDAKLDFQFKSPLSPFPEYQIEGLPPYEAQTPVFLETISEEPNSSGTVSKAGTQKGTKSTISLLSSIVASRATCHGRYQLRRQRPLYQRALNIQPKPFSDDENGCLFTPKSEDQRLQIGLANEADSRFSIELSCDKHLGGKTTVYFHINFIVDPTITCRFQSAVFEVNFSQLEDDEGKERPLTVRDYEPKDQQGEATEVQVGRVLGTSLGVSAGHSLLSLATTSSLSVTEQYTKKTASRIMGARASPSTVNWTFKEDEGLAGRNGLAATYVVHACIPSTGLTSIRFWAKGILVRPRRPKVGLKIGSAELPSEKLLDLHFVHFKEAWH